MKVIEEWNKFNPKIPIAQAENPNTWKKINAQRARYGNYEFRSALMNVLEMVNNPNILVQVEGYNTQYFKILQKQLRSILTKMVKLL